MAAHLPPDDSRHLRGPAGRSPRVPRCSVSLPRNSPDAAPARARRLARGSDSRSLLPPCARGAEDRGLPAQRTALSAREHGEEDRPPAVRLRWRPAAPADGSRTRRRAAPAAVARSHAARGDHRPRPRRLEDVTRAARGYGKALRAIERARWSAPERASPLRPRRGAQPATPPGCRTSRRLAERVARPRPCVATRFTIWLAREARRTADPLSEIPRPPCAQSRHGSGRPTFPATPPPPRNRGLIGSCSGGYVALEIKLTVPISGSKRSAAIAVGPRGEAGGPRGLSAARSCPR